MSNNNNFGSDNYPVSESAVRLIRGWELLHDHYGKWPSFHDMEIIRMILERAPTDYAATSNLRVVFFTFDLDKPPSDPKRKQAHTEILFSDLHDLKVEGWDHQNSIIGVSITRERIEPLNTDAFRVFWGGCMHEVNFSCSDITVVDVMDLNPFEKSFPYMHP